MTRYDTLAAYKIVDGKIATQGPFEGQAVYLPHFWYLYLSGDAHEVSGDVAQFSVRESDRTQFPELGNRQVVRLRAAGTKIEEA